jgi:hypothetical protein
VSNQLRGRPDELPYDLSKVVQGKTDVHHLSWWRILTEARRAQHERRIDDPDQAWLLGELIRYLADERSGCAALDGMGSSWTKVRDGVRAQTIGRRDPALLVTVQRWEQLIEYVGLLLSQELGTDVTQKLRADAQARGKRAAQRLLDDGVLRAELHIKDAAGPLILEADLRAGQTRAAARIDAPEKGQARGRIGWLLRQLKEAPGDLRVDIAFERAHRTQGTTLAKVRHFFPYTSAPRATPPPPPGTTRFPLQPISSPTLVLRAHPGAGQSLMQRMPKPIYGRSLVSLAFARAELLKALFMWLSLALVTPR